MERHRIGLERIHDVDHVLSLRVIAGVAAVPCIAAVQQQRIGAVRADRVDHGRHTVQPAYAAVGLGQRAEIVIGQRIGGRAAVVDAIELAEIRAGDVRHRTAVVTNANVHRRLAEVDRL